MDSIHLSGAEDVRQAGSSISGAAEQMSNAGSNMNYAASSMREAVFELTSALERNKEFMTDWLQKFEQIMVDHGSD